MNAIATVPVWLAVTRVSDLAPKYQAPADDGNWPMLIGSAIVLLIVTTGIVVLRRRGQSVIAPSCDPLTIELANAFGLDLHHRVLLEQVARQANVTHTAELFLSQDFFDRACQEAARVKKFRPGQRTTLGEVRRAAFA